MLAKHGITTPELKRSVMRGKVQMVTVNKSHFRIVDLPHAVGHAAPALDVSQSELCKHGPIPEKLPIRLLARAALRSSTLKYRDPDGS